MVFQSLEEAPSHEAFNDQFPSLTRASTSIEFFSECRDTNAGVSDPLRWDEEKESVTTQSSNMSASVLLRVMDTFEERGVTDSTDSDLLRNVIKLEDIDSSRTIEYSDDIDDDGDDITADRDESSDDSGDDSDDEDYSDNNYDVYDDVTETDSDDIDDILADLRLVRTHRELAAGGVIIEVEVGSLPYAPTLLAYRDEFGEVTVPMEMRCNQAAMEIIRVLKRGMAVKVSSSFRTSLTEEEEDPLIAALESSTYNDEPESDSDDEHDNADGDVSSSDRDTMNTKAKCLHECSVDRFNCGRRKRKRDFDDDDDDIPRHVRPRYA